MWSNVFNIPVTNGLMQGTLRKVPEIHVISARSENTFSFLQWLSMREQFLRQKKFYSIAVMAQIFTDIQTGNKQ